MSAWERQGYPRDFETVVGAAQEQANERQRQVEELRHAREEDTEDKDKVLGPAD